MNEKYASPLNQLDRVCLFITMFSLIFTVYRTNVRSFSPPFGLIMVPSRRSQREPGTFWTCYHKYEVDVSIQEIRTRRPAALLSLCDALNRHSCRRRSLINCRMKEQKEDEA